MSRDNVGVRVNTIDGSPVAIMLGHLSEIVEVQATKEVEAHTLVVMDSGNKYKVKEKIVDIERKAAAYGVLKISG